jgi:hypothetical protein
MSNIKEDFLEVDSRIPGQNYCCLSFLSPEKVIKNKEVFFVTKFLHHVFNDKEQYTEDIRKKLADNKNITYKYINELYLDWKFNKLTEMELEFSEMNDYQTSMRGIKVRGTYETQKEAKKRADILRKKDPNFSVFVAQVGYWLPWDPEPSEIEEQEYQESELNELMKKYKENIDNRDFIYEKDKQDRLQRAKDEVRKRKEESEKLRRDESLKEPLKLDDESQSLKKIGNLRDILNDIDENVYETEKSKMEYEKKEFSKLEKNIDSEIENALNNFTNSDMEALDDIDPWMKRKLELENNQTCEEQSSSECGGGGSK